MSTTKDFTNESELVAVRLPKVLRAKAKIYCQKEDLNLSQLMRRAIKREINQPIAPVEAEATR